MNDIQRYLVDEMVEEYRAGRLTRRELLRRATMITGNAAIAATVLGRLGAAPAVAAPGPAPRPRTASQSAPAIRTSRPG